MNGALVPFSAGTPVSRRIMARHEQRGSVLIVALLIAALIALALGSYLNLNLTSARLAKRSFHQHAAFNLAEAGAEEALWSFNQADLKSKAAWTDWTRDGNTAWRKINGFDFGSNTTGSVKVYVDNADPAPGTRPKIVSLSSVESPGQSSVTKMIEITLARRSAFANGLMAKDAITFSGANASVDSWDSDPDGDPDTAPVPYSLPVRNDRGTVASASVMNTAVLINHATVWGYVSTGGELPQIGPSGSIGPFGTAPGVIDPTRITTDFSANFEAEAAPEGGTVIANVGTTLGTEGETTSWRTPNLALRGNDTLTILGDVTLVLTAGSGIRALEVTGQAAIIVPQGSSLRLYVEGDVHIAGNGAVNQNGQPINLQLWGTHEGDSLQDIHLAGNAALNAVVHAPGAKVAIVGNGDVMGAVVAHSISLNGNTAFHYDEALGRWGDGQPFGAVRWESLSSEAARSRYESLLQGL